MATLETALTAELLSKTGVTSIVGQRIWWQVAAQATTTPYIVLDAISKRPVHDHSGAAGLTEARVSALCHAPTYANAKGAAAAVATALDGRRGTIQGVAFGALLVESEEDAGWDEQTKMHVVAVEVRVLYQ